MMQLERWKDAVALVTGASSGIGEAIAVALAQAGLKVAVCARRMERLEQLGQRLGLDASRYLAFAADLRDASAIEEMFEAIRARWGGVQVMVNNAGLGHDAPLIAGDTEQWREILEVNVLALCVCTREAVQDMLRLERPGHVIHISSMSGHRVPAGSGVYAASKYAVRALTEGLRKELVEHKADIRVTSLSPGVVETEFMEKYLRSKEAARENYARHKMLSAEDIAQTVCFVLGAPAHMQVHDILMRPTAQES